MRFNAAELMLLRQDPEEVARRPCGHCDAPPRDPAGADFARLARHPGNVRHILSSPAPRCRQSPVATFPGRAVVADPRLWERILGARDRSSLAARSDLGIRWPEAQAARRLPQGESLGDRGTRAIRVSAAPSP
jgi:broad specificity phosphatase PhoE